MDKNQIAMCGAYCGDCEWKAKTNCKGCQESKGEMFWGKCRVAKCCIEKNLPHCGMCHKLPCEILKEFFNNPEHGDNGERLKNLKTWAKGKNEYHKLTKKKSQQNL